MSALVELQRVVKEYAGPPAVRAVDGIDLRIQHGEAVAIVGPSGSGKSTLLHLMGALDTPTDGVVRIAGHDVASLDDRGLSALRGRTIGFVFQRFLLMEHHTARDNVASGLLYHGIDASERRRRADAALGQVGLGHRRTHRPAELSGGEQQRVAIARALVNRPAVVLADEPTGNLDTTTGAAILTLLQDIHEAGTTVVVITHDPAVAARLPRRLVVRDGRLEGDEVAA